MTGLAGRAAPLLWCVGLAACASVGRRLTIAYGAVAAQVAQDQVQIELNRSFIAAYQNRVTIDATFTVDAISDRSNPPMFDGDYHFAGRAPEIGLRLVGEIKNASSADSAVELVKQAQATERPVKITGAWRVWPEHAFGAREEQGRQTTPLRNANPDHVFEIHPITRAGGINLLHTYRPVDGYLPAAPSGPSTSTRTRKYSLEGRLPYEIVVLGLYPADR
ncbi:MAG TPA: hypothetical protein VGA78_10125 [Gemmatimonadales bacterium]